LIPNVSLTIKKKTHFNYNFLVVFFVNVRIDVIVTVTKKSIFFSRNKRKREREKNKIITFFSSPIEVVVVPFASSQGSNKRILASHEL